MKTTKIYYILDGSGSMGGTEENTVKTFNEYLYGLQGDRKADYVMTMQIFDTEGTEYLFKQKPVKDIEDLRRKDIFARSGTPLYDAIGHQIEDAEREVSREDPVMFVILTDGEENSSTAYDKKKLYDLIERKQSQGWTFLFISSSRDAISQAKSLGIDASNVAWVTDQSVRSGAYNSGVLAATQSYGRSEGRNNKGLANLIK